MANVLFVVAATFFAMAVAIQVPFFVFYSSCALLLAGQLVGKAVKG